MASDGDWGGSRKRVQAELRQVPWQSWKEWRAVRSALFSGRPRRICAALNRIAAWHSRGDVPVAVEISGEIISIHQRDAEMSPGLPCQAALSEEMLRMMYAMTIMRLVNGVVDQSQRRNSTSVAARAEAAGLPRLLVDIRHESAHNELPSISLLRLGSKEAISWLNLHYWTFQEQKLLEVLSNMKSSLMDVFHFLLEATKPKQPLEACSAKEVAVDRKQLMKARKVLKQQESLLFGRLLEVSSSAPSDLVSVLLDGGFLAQASFVGHDCARDGAAFSSAGPELERAVDVSQYDALMADPAAMVWKYVVRRLSSHMPELPCMLLTAIIGRLCDCKTQCKQVFQERRQGVASDGKPAGSTAPAMDRFIRWCAWLLGEKQSAKDMEYRPRKASKFGADWGPSSAPKLQDYLSDEQLRGLLLKCLHNVSENKRLEQLVPLFASQIGSQLLLKQGVGLARLCSVEVRHDYPERFMDTAGESASATSKPSNPSRQGQDKSVVSRSESGPIAHRELSHSSVSLMDKTGSPATVSLADAKEQQMALMSRHYADKEGNSGSPGSSTNRLPSTPSKWKLMKTQRPCPIGLLLPGRYMELRDLDESSEEGSDCEDATEITGAATTSSAPDEHVTDQAASVPEQQAADTTSPAPCEADLKQGTTVVQESGIGLKGCLLQNGSFQPCTDDFVAILQASIHVL